MAEGGSDDIQFLACIKDVGFEETETEMMAKRADGKFIIQHHHYHRNLYLGSVYYGDGDIVQGSKTEVNNSQIEALIARSGESDPPTQQHSEELSGAIAQAALEWVDEEKIPAQGIENAGDNSAGNQIRHKQILRSPDPVTNVTALVKRIENAGDTSAGNQTRHKQILGHPDSGTNVTAPVAKRRTKRIENADDTSAGNQTRLKQILGNPDSGTNVTAPVPKRRTKPAIFHSGTKPIQENILDIELILLEEFKENALENENQNDKTALEMMNLYNNEDVAQDIRDFRPLFTTIWRAITLKIVKRFLERHLAGGCKISPFVEGIFIKLISKYDEANKEEKSLHAFISRVSDVIKLGEHFRSCNNFIHAVVLFYAAGKLLKLKNDINISVLNITDCVGRIMQVNKAMRKHTLLKQIAIEHVIPLMHEMTQMLRSIPGSTIDIRAANEVWCLYYIGCSYWFCGEFKQSLDMLEPAIDHMKRQFGDEAEKYRLYGICLCTAADAYNLLGDYTKAIEKYLTSLKAAQKANDWQNDGEKDKMISRTKENLQLADAKLKQSLET